MEITLADEKAYFLKPVLSWEQARERAWDKKIQVFSSGLTSIFSRPKSEDVEVAYSERRLEPFWHVVCSAHYVYDRTRQYAVPVPYPEVQTVTMYGQDFSIVREDTPQIILTGVEHCRENNQQEAFLDGVSGEEQSWVEYLKYDRDEITDFEAFSPEGDIVVPPKVRASFVVRQLLGGMLKPVQADTLLEERVEVEKIDLYYRPIYAFEYLWKSKDRKAVGEFDGLTGELSAGGTTVRQQISAVLTTDLLFDVGIDAVDLLVPGGGIAIKVAKSVVDSRRQKNPQP
ncbi:MAG: hypothetical protein SVX38_01325 [Chloroflexota bacterium]|nr:hypothetical protein [Chloroflexota bacterium]